MNNENGFKIENEKIIIKANHELIDVIRKIEKSEADKIVLTFTEHSDILVSPINLKVLQDKADGLNKALIAQVMQNPIGIRNAQQASMSATDSPAIIPEEEWKEAYSKMVDRQKLKNSKLKSSSHKVIKVDEKQEDQKQSTEVEEMPVTETVKPKEESKFSKTVESAINRSKEELKSGKQRVIEEDGVVLALGEDISVKPIQKPMSLVGKDFATMEQVLDTEEDPHMEKAPIRKGKKKSIISAILKLFGKIGAWFALLPVKIAKVGAKTGFKILFWRIILPILVLLGFSGWLAYRMLPLIKVDMYIESKPIEISQTFEGDPTVTVLDLETGQIPVKLESVEKNRADNTTPTGIAYRGEKAEGIALFKYLSFIEDGEVPVTIPAGTVITSSSGLSYETTTAFTLGDGGLIFKSVAVRATDVGEEYNIPSGTGFTVSGFDETSIIAESEGAFSGGSKEEYTVVAQVDVDDVVEELEKNAFKDAEDELKSLATGDWVIIDSTIDSEQTGDISTDVPVGAEADIVNISISTESTALYYKKGSIESKVKDILSNAAIDQNLFENNSEIELKLDEEIEVSIKVDGVTGETVTVSLKASGRIQMEVNTELIVEDLAGLNWEDGSKYLNDLSYVAKPTEVQFIPDSFPKFLRYYSDRDGRILITVNEIEVTETVEEE